jgi:protein-S-isoprenylcysteine O-methyltransferase Ste14
LDRPFLSFSINGREYDIGKSPVGQEFIEPISGLALQPALLYPMNARSTLPFPPPFLALGLILVAGAAAIALPSLPIPIPYHALLGLVVLAIGVGTAVAGFSTFKRSGTPVRPGAEPLQLVTTGPYRLTRNPMYLGLLFFLVSGFFFSQSLYFLAPPVVFFLVINIWQIPFEEKLLVDRFGEPYRAYCGRVRRWL